MKFEKYSRSFLHFHTKSVPNLIIKYLPQKKFSIADFGAGDGVILVGLQLGGYLTNATSILAIDISSERCDRLKQYTNFSVLCSDVTNIPTLASKSVDYIICTQVIEHVDQYKLLNEIRRVLRDDGKLYIASLIKKWYGWWYYRTTDGKWAIDPTHLREYSSQKEFEGIMKNSGFKVLETTLTPLRLSIVEFLVRRVIVPLLKPRDANSFFLRHKFGYFLKEKLNLHPPGYHIIEVVAKKGRPE